MKTALLLTGLLAVSSLSGHAQAPAASPKPKDNTILIQTQDSAATALKKIAQAFVAQGYTVEKLDAQFLTLTLTPKTLSTKYNPVLTAHAVATAGANSQLRVTGEYTGFVGTVPLGNIAQFYGSEWACNKATFRALEKVAVAYPAGQISYSKQ